MSENHLIIIPQETIQNKILLIRGQKVMLDRDLASLYGVSTSHLKRQVKRNPKRFPNDFMFALSKKELKDWRCQFGTSNSDKIGLRYTPFAFTEHGILMLSSVLNSERAIQVNIQIMRAFSKLREVLAAHKQIQKKIEEHDHQIRRIFQIIEQLLTPPTTPKKRIGFLTEESE